MVESGNEEERKEVEWLGSGGENVTKERKRKRKNEERETGAWSSSSASASASGGIWWRTSRPREPLVI